MPKWIAGTVNNQTQEMAANVVVRLGEKPEQKNAYPVDNDTFISIVRDESIEEPELMVPVEVNVLEHLEVADLLQDYQIVEEERVQQEKPFVVVEQMPSFPGGDSELRKFLSENLTYPLSAQENGIQGRVIIRFVVGKDGSISDIVVLRGIDPDCDNEAVSVMKKSPKWMPGKQNGREVNVFFTLPVVFKLEEPEKDDK
jgi:protein TonB